MRRALCLLLALASGCLIEPDVPPGPPRRPASLAPARVAVGPVRDASDGDLREDGARALAERVATRLATQAEARRKRRRPAIDVAPPGTAADLRLEVEVTRFSEGSRALWFFPGLDAGQAAFRYEARLVRVEDGAVIARAEGGDASYRYLDAPAGPRGALLEALAARLGRFVERRQ